MEAGPAKPRRASVAIVLGLFCTGLGHVYVGRPWLGLTIYAVLTAFLVGGTTLAVAIDVPLFTTLLIAAPLAASAHIGQMLWAGAIAKGLSASFIPRWFNRKLFYLAYVVVLAFVPSGELLKQFVVESFKHPSGSMIPTLMVGDHFFVRKLRYQPHRGDVVVFHYSKDEEKRYVKRIVAVGGDKIAVRDDVIYLNGSPIARRKLSERCTYQDFDQTADEWTTRDCIAFEEQLGDLRYRVIQDIEAWDPPDTEEQEVPPGHVFLLGDNRAHSHDSRIFGAVAVNKLVGQAESIWWSWGPDGVRWERVGQEIR